MQTCPKHCLLLVSWLSFLVWSQIPLSFVHEWIMMKSSNHNSNGNIFSVNGPLCGPYAGHRWIPPKRPVTRSFDVFFDPCWVKNHEAGDLGRHCAHYDVIVIWIDQLTGTVQAFSGNDVRLWYGRLILNRWDPVTSYSHILLCEHWFG